MSCLSGSIKKRGGAQHGRQEEGPQEGRKEGSQEGHKEEEEVNELLLDLAFLRRGSRWASAPLLSRSRFGSEDQSQGVLAGGIATDRPEF
jgi:hypothetical protein